VRTRSDDAAESGAALVSSMMEPIALTQSSPAALGAGRPVGLQLFKPKRARACNWESPLVGFRPEADVAQASIDVGFHG
jgi:hypothetical protein